MYKMYQPSNAMPIDNYSCVQPSTQQKTFTENNICRFSLPFNTIPFFDPHSSYLQVLAECSGTDKMELNGNSSVIIKYIRLSVNGIVLEEVDEFNQLAHLYNHYGNDDSSREHEAVFTMDSGVDFTTGLMGNQSVVVANGEKKVKLIIPMKECGLFSSLEVVPLMAFGENLDVEIRFAPNNEVLKTYQRSGLGRKNDITEIEVNEGITNGAAITQLTFTAPYKGWTSVGDCPLQIGEKFQLKKSDGSNAGGFGEIEITALARTATTTAGQTAGTEFQNIITITFASTTPSETEGSGLYIKKVKDTNNSANPTASITYSNVEWYLQKVVPPAQYVNSLKKQLNSPQGFQYDIHTWTCYKSSMLTAVKAQTIEIPAYQSRAKAVIVIPRIANQTPTLNLDNALPTPETALCPYYRFSGEFQNLKDYQWQVNNGLRVPTRPVNLDVMNGHLKHLSAEHLIQLTQTLGSSNIGVRNIKDARDNFCIGRQLSKYGGTTNLNSAMRVYLNYQGNADPVAKIQPITFVNHINRVAVNASGLQVFN